MSRYNKDAIINPNSYTKYSICFLFFTIIGVGFIVFYWDTGHDYYTYVDAWDYVAKNHFQDKTTGNAYGPLFLLFAYIYEVNYDLPRFVFLLTYILSVFIASHQYGDSRLKKELMWWILVVWSPLIIMFGMKYGNNDILMSGLFLLSLLNIIKKKVGVSGFFLGLAISVKFVPLLLIPVLMIGCGSIKSAFRFLVGVVLSITTCFMIAYFCMEYHPFDAIIYGANRSSKMLSIFRFLSDINVDFLSTPLVITSVIIASLCTYIRKWSWEYAICLVYILTISFYKVGHHQYYIPMFSWLLFLVFRDGKMIPSTVKSSFFILFIWINFMAFIYPFTDNYRNEYFWIREIIGLPTFLIQLFLILSLVLYMERSRHQESYLEKA